MEISMSGWEWEQREKGVWENVVKNRSNVSVKGRRIWDNGWIAKINNDDDDDDEKEEDEEGKSEVQKAKWIRKRKRKMRFGF